MKLFHHLSDSVFEIVIKNLNKSSQKTLKNSSVERKLPKLLPKIRFMKPPKLSHNNTIEINHKNNFLQTLKIK